MYIAGLLIFSDHFFIAISYIHNYVLAVIHLNISPTQKKSAHKTAIMKKAILACLLLFFVSPYCFTQIKFSDETKKFIEYNDSITVFKNALVIDGKGNAAKPH